LHLPDLFVGPAQGRPGPVVKVLATDDPIASAVVRPRQVRTGLIPARRDLLAWVLAPPLGDQVRNVRNPHAEDERQPGRLGLVLVGLGDHVRLRHDRDSGD
jgi:hypothetical protein